VTPFALTEEETAVVLTLAAPLERGKRDAFLAQVASTLAKQPARGPGVVHRIGREVQREFFEPPMMSDAGERSRTPRQGFGLWPGRS
jgi:hypothetical protein